MMRTNLRQRRLWAWAAWGLLVFGLVGTIQAQPATPPADPRRR